MLDDNEWIILADELQQWFDFVLDVLSPVQGEQLPLSLDAYIVASRHMFSHHPAVLPVGRLRQRNGRAVTRAQPFAQQGCLGRLARPIDALKDDVPYRSHKNIRNFANSGRVRRSDHLINYPNQLADRRDLVVYPPQRV